MTAPRGQTLFNQVVIMVVDSPVRTSDQVYTFSIDNTGTGEIGSYRQQFLYQRGAVYRRSGYYRTRSGWHRESLSLDDHLDWWRRRLRGLAPRYRAPTRHLDVETAPRSPTSIKTCAVVRTPRETRGPSWRRQSKRVKACRTAQP